MTVEQLYEALEERFPRSLSCMWDHDGKMVLPEGRREVKRVLCCLDCTDGAIEKAKAEGCELIVSHHPLLFRPLNALDREEPNARRALELYSSGIALFSFHTRFDCGKGGVNDELSALFGLEEVCSFPVEGLPMGRIGKLPKTLSAKELAEKVKAVLGCKSLRLTLNRKEIRRLAVLGGSGGDAFNEALTAGADGYLTGEASYHEMLDAADRGLCMVVAGHDYTENPAAEALGRQIKELLPSAEVLLHREERISTF